MVTLLITLQITTHEPPSRVVVLRVPYYVCGPNKGPDPTLGFRVLGFRV